MRHSLTAIYANAEFLERHDICARVRADLLLEIQDAVLAMTERIDSLLQFGSSGPKSRLVRARVSLVVEKAVAAVKFHPDGRNVSITADKFPPAEVDIDARNLESVIYNLLLNACQAAARSTHEPKVKVHLTGDAGKASKESETIHTLHEVMSSRFQLLGSRRELLAITLGDRILAAMRIDKVSECVGETKISHPDGALYGRSKEPEVGAFVRDEVYLWHALSHALAPPFHSSL
jgi:signal transduction histidine kinase